MKASMQRLAAIGSLVALAMVSGCASLDANVSVDDQGYSIPGANPGNDILEQLSRDSEGGDS